MKGQQKVVIETHMHTKSPGTQGVAGPQSVLSMTCLHSAAVAAEGDARRWFLQIFPLVLHSTPSHHKAEQVLSQAR